MIFRSSIVQKNLLWFHGKTMSMSTVALNTNFCVQHGAYLFLSHSGNTLGKSMDLWSLSIRVYTYICIYISMFLNEKKF
jgi:hypothetical protein